MRVIKEFVCFTVFFGLACVHLHLWRYSIPAALIVTTIEWARHRKPITLGIAYRTPSSGRSIPQLSLGWAGVSISAITALIALIAEY